MKVVEWLFDTNIIFLIAGFVTSSLLQKNNAKSLCSIKNLIVFIIVFIVLEFIKIKFFS